jgi:chemotaxis protein CheZ
MPAENWSSVENVATPPAPGWAPGVADYDAILAAVLETDRGRWFLAEYASRNRRADTAEVLAAIDRLAAHYGSARADPRPDADRSGDPGGVIDRLRAELADMANAIARTKTEIAAVRPDAAHGGRILEATEQLDSVVRTTERATSDILAAAEQVQEVAWTMREQGMESEFCDRLDRYATEIYTACSFQDLTGQRTRKIIHVLRYLEARIQTMNSIWGAATQTTNQTAKEIASQAAGELATRATSEAAAGTREPRSNELVQHDIDRVMAPPDAIAVQVQEPPVAHSVMSITGEGAAVPQLAATSRPSRAPADEEKPVTLTIEGPAGSFSIVAGRPAGPEAPRKAGAASDVGVPQEPDRSEEPRAYAEPDASEEPDARQAAAPPPLAEAPAAEAAPVVAAPASTVSKEPSPREDDRPQGDVVLPLAAAPKLADLPQRPVPEPQPTPAPAPRRKADIAENLFADVMALTDEERIALFT